MPFLTFLGVFSDFPKYSKKWLIFGAFRVHQKALLFQEGEWLLG